MRQQGLDQSDPKFQKLLHIYRTHAHLLRPNTSASEQPAQRSAPPSQNAVSIVAAKAGSGGPFTMEQLQQLRAQILAYKYLSRNMALPAALLAAIRNPSSAKKDAAEASAQEDRLRRIQSPPPGMGGAKVVAASLSKPKSGAF